MLTFLKHEEEECAADGGWEVELTGNWKHLQVFFGSEAIHRLKSQMGFWVSENGKNGRPRKVQVTLAGKENTSELQARVREINKKAEEEEQEEDEKEVGFTHFTQFLIWEKLRDRKQPTSNLAVTSTHI